MRIDFGLKNGLVGKAQVVAVLAFVLAGATFAGGSEEKPAGVRVGLGSRVPGSIAAATRGGAVYGNYATEEAVLKVLWWLKATQKIDPAEPDKGYWVGGSSPLANTAFAVLTYLAHGEYPGSPSPHEADFGPVVARAINWLMDDVTLGATPDKTRMKHADGNEYAFLIATYALCEASGMTNDADVRDVARTCLTRIVKGQSATGGWDYKINPASTRDDLSFAGWALQALKAGKMAGLNPEGLDTCIKKAVTCLQKRNFKQGGFSYVASNGYPTGLTATGCFAMQLLGSGDTPEVKAALDYMRDWSPTFDAGTLDPKKKLGGAPQYYCYYATQCKYHAGMKIGYRNGDEAAWRTWNAQMQKLYTKAITDISDPVKDVQGKDHKQGYFVNKDAHSSRPVMDSCLVALQLMTYYRYLPIPNQQFDHSTPPVACAWNIKQKRLRVQREQARLAAFSLDQFMGFVFGESMSVFAGSSKFVVRSEPDGAVVLAEGRMNKPFRKFERIRLFGFREGGLFGVELLCPSKAFSTEELLAEEFGKVVALLEKKYEIPLENVNSSDRSEHPSRKFGNDNIMIKVWMADGIHLRLENLRVIEDERKRLRRQKEEREDKERVPDDEGADML